MSMDIDNNTLQELGEELVRFRQRHPSAEVHTVFLESNGATGGVDFTIKATQDASDLTLCEEIELTGGLR